MIIHLNARPCLRALDWIRAVALAVGVTSLCSGCRTVAPLPPADFAVPGWTVRQGQAIWRAAKGATELAGDVLVATHEDGRSVVQFSKTPLPFVVAQSTTNAWQVNVIPQDKMYSGRGEPPARVIWLHLVSSLRGARPRKPLVFQRTGEQDWKLENRATGEMISGFLAP